MLRKNLIYFLYQFIGEYALCKLPTVLHSAQLIEKLAALVWSLMVLMITGNILLCV